jgi:hypothetical protein
MTDTQNVKLTYATCILKIYYYGYMKQRYGHIISEEKKVQAVEVEFLGKQWEKNYRAELGNTSEDKSKWRKYRIKSRKQTKMVRTY